MTNFKAGAKSGKNSTRIVFDEDALAFKIAAIVGETQSTSTTTKNDANIEKTLEDSVTKNTEIILKIIPWWVWLIAAIWFLPQLIQKLKVLSNPIITLIKK